MKTLESPIDWLYHCLIAFLLLVKHGARIKVNNVSSNNTGGLFCGAVRNAVEQYIHSCTVCPLAHQTPLWIVNSCQLTKECSPGTSVLQGTDFGTSCLYVTTKYTCYATYRMMWVVQLSGVPFSSNCFGSPGIATFVLQLGFFVRSDRQTTQLNIHFLSSHIASQNLRHVTKREERIVHRKLQCDTAWAGKPPVGLFAPTLNSQTTRWPTPQSLHGYRSSSMGNRHPGNVVDRQL